MDAPSGLERPPFSHRDVVMEDKNALPAEVKKADSIGTAQLKRKNETLAVPLEPSRVQKSEGIDRQALAKYVSSYTEKPFVMEGMSDTEVQRVAQQAMLAPLRELCSYGLTGMGQEEVQEFVFELLKGPHLIPEIEELFIQPHLQREMHRYTAPFLKLLYNGKIPSHSEGGVRAVVDFLDRTKDAYFSYNPEQPSFFNSKTPSALLEAFDQFKEEEQLEILKLYGARKGLSRCTKTWTLFDHYFDKALNQKRSAELHRLIIAYIRVQPMGCALRLSRAKTLSKSDLVKCIALALETLADNPFNTEYLEPISVLARNASSASLGNQPRFDAALQKILNRIIYPIFHHYTYWNCHCILETILAIAVENSPEVKDEYVQFLKKALWLDSPLLNVDQQQELFKLLEQLIEMDSFPEIWPAVQWHLSTKPDPFLRPLTQKFFIKVAYRHPQTTLDECVRPMLIEWVANLRADGITEKELLAVAAVFHYAPQCLSHLTNFRLLKFNSSWTINWQALALIHTRLSPESQELYRREYAKMGYGFDEWVTSTEVTLRLGLLNDPEKIAWRLNQIPKMQQQSHVSVDSLLVLVETIAYQAAEGKIVPPLQPLSPIIVQLPPSKRLSHALSILTKNNYNTIKTIIIP